MAAAGGHWSKSNYKGHIGEMVFLPAIKDGEANATYWPAGSNKPQELPIAGPMQGGLIAHPNINDNSGWAVTHIPTGLAINTKYSSKEAALVAMYKLNSTGIKWAKIKDGSDLSKRDGTLMSSIASAYSISFKKSDALAIMKNLGIKAPKAGNGKMPKTPKTTTPVEEAPKPNTLFGF